MRCHMVHTAWIVMITLVVSAILTFLPFDNSYGEQLQVGFSPTQHCGSIHTTERHTENELSSAASQPYSCCDDFKKDTSRCELMNHCMSTVSLPTENRFIFLSPVINTPPQFEGVNDAHYVPPVLERPPIA